MYDALETAHKLLSEITFLLLKKPLRFEDQELVRAYREKMEKHENPIGKYNEVEYMI
jgi:hypothetical protein